MLEPGHRIGGDFVVERPLASGGMGTLYVALQESTGRRRALKVLHPLGRSDERRRKRFLREARATARIESDHVVQVISAGAQDDLHFVVMELLRGEDLAAHVRRRGALEPAEAAAVLGQIAAGLSALHAAGIIHRDLKPENVFLAETQERLVVKLLDLGVAALVDEARLASTVGVGTPLWMAPEQAEGDGEPRVTMDVWAFGLVAFYTLVGEPFWEAASPVALHREREGVLRSASSRAASAGARVPEGFDAWFAQAVEREAARRTATIDLAWRGLAALLPPPSPEVVDVRHRAPTSRRLKVQVDTPTSRRSTVDPMGKTRSADAPSPRGWPLVAAAVGATAAAALIGWRMSTAGPAPLEAPPPAASPASAPSARAEAAPLAFAEVEAWPAGRRVEQAIATPDGAVVYPLDGGLWRFDPRTGARSRIPADPGWLPLGPGPADGELILWRPDEGVVIRAGSGAVRPIERGRLMTAAAAGRWLLTRPDESRVFVTDLEDGSRREVPLISTTWLNGSCTFSPDGRWFTIASRGSSRSGFSLRLVRVDGGATLEAVSGELNLPGGSALVRWDRADRLLYGVWDAAREETQVWELPLDDRAQPGVPRRLGAQKGALVAVPGAGETPWLVRLLDDYDVMRARVSASGDLAAPEVLLATPRREVSSDAWRRGAVAITSAAGGRLGVGWIEPGAAEPRLSPALAGDGDQATPILGEPLLYVSREAGETHLLLEPSGDAGAPRVVRTSKDPSAHPYLPVNLRGCCRGPICFTFDRRGERSRFERLDPRTGATSLAFELAFGAQSCAVLDADHLAYVAQGDRVIVRDLRADAERSIPLPADLDAYRVTSRGGFPLTLTAYQAGPSPAYVIVRLDERGRTTVLHRDPDAWLFNPTYSPDGTWLVFSRQPQRSTLLRILQTAPRSPSDPRGRIGGP